MTREGTNLYRFLPQEYPRRNDNDGNDIGLRLPREYARNDEINVYGFPRSRE